MNKQQLNKVDRFSYNYILPPPPKQPLSQNEDDYGKTEDWRNSQEKKALKDLKTIFNERQ